MAQIALVGDKGCISAGTALADGVVGQVLGQGMDGPEWSDAGTFDPCNMTAAEVTCLVQGFDFSQMAAAQITTIMNALDFSQLSQAQVDDILANIDFSNLTAGQITALSMALRGELVQDAFGLDLGYLLTL